MGGWVGFKLVMGVGNRYFCQNRHVQRLDMAWRDCCHSAMLAQVGVVSLPTALKKVQEVGQQIVARAKFPRVRAAMS